MRTVIVGGGETGAVWFGTTSGLPEVGGMLPCPSGRADF